MSSVSHSDSVSKDSGFSGSVKKKDKDRHDSITITYWLWGEPIPYRTSLPGKCVTLGQFKTLLPPRRGNYRFYFKRSTDDRDCEVNVVL
ncbi:Axin-1 [Desmophyllum pertusum]|uniref:Axin-1 n=1 Tax=Desmophyllum pertusum TaxID=174260 RepID=A0A9X0CLD5_9CNID|nr:Axin-1 [Desmophyllum pertusum]